MNLSSGRYQVSIEADPTLPIIRITRDFDATPAQLMRAHTDPKLFARWVGPNWMETTILDWDATTGGRWRYVAARDGEEYGFHGCFHEVGEDRIVQTSPSTGSPTALPSRRCGSRISAMVAPGCTPSRWLTASRAATSGWPAGWRPASRRATPSSTPSSPSSDEMGCAEEHRRIGGEFTATVEGTTAAAWDRPAPPEGWVTRDVVRHLVEWFPAFLQGATGITLPTGPSVDDDPVGAWRSHTDALQALLDDRATAERQHEFPHLGRMPLGQAIDRVYTGDVFLHRWDLARATGQDETLDPETCAQMLEAMLPMDDALRQSGHYGPRVEVPDDADIQTKLLAFIGRTP
jgi:uncharacterized protein (TIGR03086 family)